jgi:hypothetical protein
MTRAIALLLLMAAVSPVASAQDEGDLQAALRREREQLASSCAGFSVSKIGSCAYTLATGSPLHVTFGSIAPQNGFAVGPAFGWHHTPGENWRINWSTDAVYAPGGAWRAGAYANFVHTKVKPPVVVFGDQPIRPAAPDVYPVYSTYVQRTSLPQLSYVGPTGPESDPGQSLWTMRQTLAGGGALVPVGPGRLGLSLVGNVVLRNIDAGSRADDEDPGVGERYGPAIATGIGDSRTFFELSGGVRVTPFVGAHVRPAYSFIVDRFTAVGDAHESFTRWSADLLHELPIYRTNTGGVAGVNDPNSCGVSVDDRSCPAPSRGRYGAVSLRVRASSARADEGNAVPFYLQPTLGGSDINGVRALASYPDYFFRGTNVFAMQASVEHSLFSIPIGQGLTLPLGGFGIVEAGSARATFGDLFDDLARSYGAGLTIRAGGFPEVFLVYMWGGGRTHFTATINTSLLGGASRPSLY